MLSDFRLVAATNRDLDKMVKSGQFRQDLLFRFRTFTIELSPLRDHIQDIRELAMYHVAKICERSGMKTKGFSPEFFETLAAYDWPGNVRELIHTLESAIAVEPLNPILYPKQLPSHIRAKIVRASVAKETPPISTRKNIPENSKRLPKLKALREESVTRIEKQYLNDLMSQTNGDIREACQISGLGRARLYELMKKYHISRPIAPTSPYTI
jgi:two-component system NtrC family response regulator